MNLRNFS